MTKNPSQLDIINTFKAYLSKDHKVDSSTKQYISWMYKIQDWFIQNRICSPSFNIWEDTKLIGDIDQRLNGAFKNHWNELNKKHKNWYSAPWNKWKAFNTKPISVQYWKFAPGENASKWHEFNDNGEMRLGFHETAPHSLAHIRSKTELLQELGLDSHSNKGQNLSSFLLKSRVGDVVFANKGRSSIVGVGIIVGDYEYQVHADSYNHKKKVEWVADKIWNYTPNSLEEYPVLFNIDTFSGTTNGEWILNEYLKTYPEFSAHFAHLFAELPSPKPPTMNHPLNTIFFGPPGTGKTFRTIAKAVSIIDGIPEGNLEVVMGGREKVKLRYEELREAGQIKFITFHQSLAYEDFIEGIKPLEAFDKEGNQLITYKVKPGIFKQLCLKAKTNYGIDNFEEIYEQFVEDIQAMDSLRLTTPKFGKPFRVEINSNKNCVARPETASATPMVITKEMIKDYLFHGKIRDWKPYTTGIGNYLKSSYDLTIEKQEAEEKNFVLIIDEINRGNIAQIFGELITLIEESKREGKAEALSAVLPYSGDELTVPSNLYLVGTMNTADRSVEALDTALRRRFSFEEMVPTPKLLSRAPLDSVSLEVLLETMNSRIERLLDKDHLIGHSFFIHVHSVEELKTTFHNKIIPLLREYFYGDPGKIGLILGEGFFEQLAKPKAPAFAKFPHEAVHDYQERKMHHLRNVGNMDNLEFMEALSSAGLGVTEKVEKSGQ